MVSLQSVLVLREMVGRGYYMLLFPWKWDESTQAFEMITNKHKFLWKSWLYFGIGILSSIICIIGSSALFMELPLWQLILGLLPVAMLGFQLLIIVLLLLKSPHIICCVNSAIKLNIANDNLFKQGVTSTSINFKDGLEHIAILFKYGNFMIPLLLVPATLFMLDSKMDLFFVFNFVIDTIPGVEYFLSLGFGLITFIALTYILTITFICFIYMSFVSNWCELVTRYLATNTADQFPSQKLNQFYRSNQFYYECARHAAHDAFHFGSALVLLIQIGAIYCVISNADGFNYFLKFAMILTTAVVTVGYKVLLDFASSTTKNSALFLAEYTKGSRGACKFGKRFARSCRPLYWYIGPYVQVDESTFTNMWKDIVMENVINLLLV